MDETKELTFSEYIAAPTPHVYRAVSSSAGFEEWFSDVAEADGREGGRFYAWWNDGMYVSGMFKEAIENKTVKFSWHGNEPAPTKVYIELESRDGGTQLTLVHKGVGQGEAWDAVEKGYQAHWPAMLANLKSVLETGVDTRVYDRPMLGFFIGGLVDENLKKRLDVPVDHGMHVAGLVAGMGAERSGLKADDVIAEVDGVEVRTFQTLGPVLSKFKGGEVLNTVIYRGQERIELGIELSKRPVPEFPPAPAELKKLGRSVYKDVLKTLKTALKGVSEKEASRKPGEGEWSAKEIMAHLLVGERWSQVAWDVHPNGGKFPAYPGTNRTVEAIAKTYSMKKLFNELKKSIEVNLHMIESLPDEYAANKAPYFISANDFENNIRTHWDQHTTQVKAALETEKVITQ